MRIGNLIITTTGRLEELFGVMFDFVSGKPATCAALEMYRRMISGETSVETFRQLKKKRENVDPKKELDATKG